MNNNSITYAPGWEASQYIVETHYVKKTAPNQIHTHIAACRNIRDLHMVIDHSYNKFGKLMYAETTCYIYYRPDMNTGFFLFKVLDVTNFDEVKEFLNEFKSDESNP